jgi:hypothetical protein
MEDATYIHRLIENIKKFKLTMPPGVSYVWISISGDTNNYINVVDVRLPINYEHIIGQLSKKLFPILDNMGQKSYINPEGDVMIMYN